MKTEEIEIVIIQVFGMCDSEQINNIECRPINMKKVQKGIVEKVECSVDKGLVCNGKCSDYEIRVHCKCLKDIGKFEYVLNLP